MRHEEDGGLEIDSRRPEGRPPGIAVERKNWLFFGSDSGGQTAVVLTSFITTCNRLAIDFLGHFRDVFECIGAHPMNRLQELLPDNWKAAQTAT